MNELEYALYTINGTPFERLASDFLRVSGYEVHESGLKGTDGGWDARVKAGDHRGIAHASVRDDWRAKIREDASSMQELEDEQDEDYNLFVYVTNQEVTGQQELDMESEIQSEYGWNVQIYHRENILGKIRTEEQELAEQHLGVELGTDREHLEQVRKLRDERLEAIRTRTGVAEDLQDGPTVVLHVIPNGVFSNERKSLSGETPNPPILCDLAVYRAEVRGKSVLARPSMGTPWEAYGLLQNDGLFETATTMAVFEGKDKKFMRLDVSRGGPGFDASTIITVRRALSALADLGFSGSASVSISLLDASGASLPERSRGVRGYGSSNELQTDVYSTEPVAVTIGSDIVLDELEPAISEIWREFGRENGTENIEDDAWVGGRVRLNGDTLLEPPQDDE